MDWLEKTGKNKGVQNKNRKQEEENMPEAKEHRARGSFAEEFRSRFAELCSNGKEDAALHENMIIRFFF